MSKCYLPHGSENQAVKYSFAPKKLFLANRNKDPPLFWLPLWIQGHFCLHLGELAPEKVVGKRTPQRRQTKTQCNKHKTRAWPFNRNEKIKAPKAVFFSGKSSLATEPWFDTRWSIKTSNSGFLSTQWVRGRRRKQRLNFVERSHLNNITFYKTEFSQLSLEGFWGSF